MALTLRSPVKLCFSRFIYDQSRNSAGDKVLLIDWILAIPHNDLEFLPVSALNEGRLRKHPRNHQILDIQFLALGKEALSIEQERPEVVANLHQ